MPYAATTQLEAVNIILATIGEAPVASLTSPLTSDASLALACLNEQAKFVQTEGYPWNTDVHVTLVPDNSGNIYLASNVASFSINPKRYPLMQIVLRGNVNGQFQLYDRYNQTYNFSAYPNIVFDKIIYWMDWTALPEAARHYILIKASRVFADRSVGAETTHQYTAQDEMNAKRAMDANRVDMLEMNILNSPGTVQGLNRGGYGQLRI